MLLMNETARISDQARRAFAGKAWHGPSLKFLLRGVTAQQAAARPMPGAHTIWELVTHMTFWETQVNRRLNDLPDRPTEKLNFPAMAEATEENWNATLNELRRSNEDFRRVLSKLDPSRLDQKIPEGNKTIYVEVHGVIQHHLYHAGQIALLKKVL